MLDPAVAGAPGFADRADGRTRAGRRARALVACALLAVALHVAFLDGMAGWGARPTAPTAAALSVRTVASRAPTAPAAIEPPLEAVAPPQVEAIEPARRGPRPKPAPARSDVTAMVMEASTGLPARDVVVSTTASVAPAVEAAASAAADAANAAADAAVSPPAADTAAAANAFPPPGEPPPLYPARLPPPATMHYQVRRGFLRGDGEIRWLRAGDAYRLVLEARVGGLPLLVQTSEGAVDGNGLAPLRFLDQRARRSAQAANFVRESGRITFSGSALEWPLVAGSQDRLSWMIELAGIVAADPDPEREPPGGERAERRDLTGDRGRVAKRDHVDAGFDRHRLVRAEQRRRLDEAVGAAAGGEADVVADRDVVDAGGGDAVGQLGQPSGVGFDVLLAEHDAEARRGHAAVVASTIACVSQ